MLATSTRSIVPRGFGSPAKRALRALLRRLPARVQRIGLLALTPVMKRWPTVLHLLGVVGPGTAARGTSSEAEACGPTGAEEEAPDVSERWIHRLRTDQDSSERVRAARAVAKSVAPDVTAALVAALRDPSAEVAAEAADALRHHATDPVAVALRAVVDNADGYFSTSARAAAIRTLSAILPLGEGEPIAMAVADADADVSIAAIAGVVDRDEKQGTEVLLTVLENPRGFYLPLTRSAAARGLRRLEPPEEARLRALLAVESDRDVRDVLAEFFRGKTVKRLA